MSHAIAFDTFGLASKHAESIAEAMRDVFEENLSTSIFTKEDGRSLKAQLKADVCELRSDIFKLKSEMIIWFVGLLFAQTAIMVSIIKFIH